MTRQFAISATLVVLLAGCSHKDAEDKDVEVPDGNAVHVATSRADTTPLRAGDVRIVSVDGGIDLALIGDSISSGLSQGTLRKVAQETDTMGVKGSGFSASIEKMVKNSVQSAIGTRVAFPLSGVNGARYENGRIEFDWNGKDPKVFTNTKVNKRPLLESFSAGDSQRFVDAVNARKAKSAK
jgi:hypothetical protein